MQIKSIGEFGLISKIARFSAASDSQVVKAIGDDAAVVSLDRGKCLLVTTDILKEGIHFEKAYSSALALGRKCLSVNLSDIAAMGAAATYYFVSIAIPPDTPYNFIRDLYRGMAAQAKRYGAHLLGGDTTASQDSLVISITLLGKALKKHVRYRSSALPGERIYVTGTLGDSALGLCLLKKGPATDKNPLVKRHIDPLPRVEAGRALAESGAAHAMMDISDGLLGDLRHILKASRVGATLYLDRLPLSASYAAQCPACSENYYLPALTGGEDYELLFTVPQAREKKVRELSESLGLPMTCIGEIGKPRTGLRIFGPDGKPVRFSQTGFTHF